MAAKSTDEITRPDSRPGQEEHVVIFRLADEFYALVREASPGPRLEMFAREERDGFTTWGNETGRFS